MASGCALVKNISKNLTGVVVAQGPPKPLACVRFVGHLPSTPIKLNFYGSFYLYFIIYKITNCINNKFYIGKHKTNNINDCYFGSGKLIKRAIKKYGIENFTKEIIHICNSEKEMILREKILVVPDIEISYNIKEGGDGGWDYINENRIWDTEEYRKSRKGKDHLQMMRNIFFSELKSNTIFSQAFSESVQLGVIKSYQNGRIPSFLNKKHKEDSKKKIGKANSFHQKGEKNSQFGTIWINNGNINKKINKKDLDFWIEKEYIKGRINNN